MNSITIKNKIIKYIPLLLIQLKKRDPKLVHVSTSGMSLKRHSCNFNNTQVCIKTGNIRQTSLTRKNQINRDIIQLHAYQTVYYSHLLAVIFIDLTSLLFTYDYRKPFYRQIADRRTTALRNDSTRDELIRDKV